MTRNQMFGTLRNLLGKTFALALCSGVLTVASYAQSANIYYQSNGAYYGRVTVFPTHFQIETGNTVIKTFANSCRATSSGGVAGVVCSFGQFRNGQHIYSGWSYFFRNGLVYLCWTNENVGGFWRTINSGWYGFRP